MSSEQFSASYFNLSDKEAYNYGSIIGMRTSLPNGISMVDEFSPNSAGKGILIQYMQEIADSPFDIPDRDATLKFAKEAYREISQGADLHHAMLQLSTKTNNFPPGRARVSEILENGKYFRKREHRRLAKEFSKRVIKADFCDALQTYRWMRPTDGYGYNYATGEVTVEFNEYDLQIKWARTLCDALALPKNWKISNLGQFDLWLEVAWATMGEIAIPYGDTFPTMAEPLYRRRDNLLAEDLVNYYLLRREYNDEWAASMF